MKIVTFIVKKLKDTASRIWWHFNEKRILREYQEEQRRQAEQLGIDLEKYYLAQADEEIRKGKEKYWSELDQQGFDTAYWKKLDKER